MNSPALTVGFTALKDLERSGWNLSPCNLKRSSAILDWQADIEFHGGSLVSRNRSRIDRNCEQSWQLALSSFLVSPCGLENKTLRESAEVTFNDTFLICSVFIS